jgi:rod shape-determining protein MreC
VHDKQVRRRRAVLALLVAASLILLTAYFGESPDSPLHSIQRGIVEVLSPVQEGASKVLSPVRDVAGWFSSTLNAKSQNTQLRRENARLTQEYDQAKYAEFQNQELEKDVALDQSDNLESYGLIAAHVIAQDPTVWFQTVEVDAGSDNGVKLNDPVIGGNGGTGDSGGLVGRVSFVGPSYSEVTLLTDYKFAVGAEVLDGQSDTGILVPQTANPDAMLLEQVPSHAPIQQGEQVVTSGFKDPSNPIVNSLFPPGIPIGTVSNADPDTLANDQEVQVAPDVDLRTLSVVQILTRATPSSTERAQVGP